MENRLFEAGAGSADGSYPLFSDAAGHVKDTDISIFEQSTGVQYNAVMSYSFSKQNVPRYSQRFSVSYVTGSHASHAFKTGFQLEELVQDISTAVHGNVNYTFNNR